MRPRFLIISSLILSFCPAIAPAQWVPTIDSTTIISFATTGTHIYAGAYEEPTRLFGFTVFSSTTAGSSWMNVGNPVGGTNVAGLVINQGNIFAGTNGQWFWGIYRSTDNGTSWTATWTDRQVLSLGAKEGRLFAGLCCGDIAVSTDNGTSWTPVHLGGTGAQVDAFAVKDTLLFAATDGGGIFLSTNDGTSWTAVNDGLANTRVLSLGVADENLFAATFGGGVFISTNNGTSWTAVNNGLTHLSVYAIAARDTGLFAGTGGGGVFLSTNNGANWTSANEGLTGMNVMTLTIHDNFLFAGTLSQGVWRRPLSDFVSVHENSASMPEQFLLEQNYPNPFNPQTTIGYQLPSRVNVSLKIFDLLGREVATLVNGLEEPGFKSVSWDASRASSGTYFYQLKSGRYVSTKKMLVIK